MKEQSIITAWLKLSKSKKTVNINDPHGNYLGFFHISSLEKHQKGEINSVPLLKLPTKAFKKKEDK